MGWGYAGRSCVMSLIPLLSKIDTWIIGKKLILTDLVDDNNPWINTVTILSRYEFQIIILASFLKWRNIFLIELWTKLVLRHFYGDDGVWALSIVGEIDWREFILEWESVFDVSDWTEGCVEFNGYVHAVWCVVCAW